MIIKFASASVIDVIQVPVGANAKTLRKAAHRVGFDYQPEPGYLYIRSRAISSRCNDNWDEFPADEITKAYKTFVGKPVFVNHHNDNHRRARGVVIDAALHEDTNPDGSPDVWVEVLMMVDAVRFPKLAKAILTGHIDRTSMGTDVAFSVCSVCNNKATSPLEYCFVPGTLVSLADGSTRAIEEMVAGDSVLTHEGPALVSAVGSRPWKQDIISIKRAGYAFPVEMTHDHPCYVKRDGEWSRVCASEVVVGDWIKVAYPDDEQHFTVDLLELSPDFVDIGDGTVILATRTTAGSKRRLTAEQAEEICNRRCTESGASLAREFGVSQATICNITKGLSYGREISRIAWVRSGMPRFVSSSEALATLLGWYLAEGSVEDFTKHGDAKIITWSLNASEEHVADSLDEALAKFGVQPTRRYRDGQRLTAKVSNAPLAALLCYLGGKTTATSRAQKTMAPEVVLMPRDLQMVMLGAYMEGDGWHTGVNTKSECRTASASLARQLAVVGARVFGDIPRVWENRTNPGGPTNRKRTSLIYHVTLGDGVGPQRNRRRIDGPYYEARVSSVERQAYQGDVYDLTVPGPHTFAVEGMITHNCQHIPRMKGQRVYKTTASGKKIGVLVSERCFGLKFFENSLLVEEPADPTAFFLGVEAGPGVIGPTAVKVASSTAIGTSSTTSHYDSVAIGKHSIHDVGDPEAYLDRQPDLDLTLPVDEEAIEDSTHRRIHDGDLQLTPGQHHTRSWNPLEDSTIHSLNSIHAFFKRAELSPISKCKECDADKDAHCAIDCGGVRLYRNVKESKTYPYDTCNSCGKKTGGDGDYDAQGNTLCAACKAKKAASKLAYGETVAPRNVDTLRDEECPVCAEKDSYNGDECQMCGFIQPPKMFQDPDLDMAKQIDLRKDNTEGYDPRDPNSDPQGGGQVPQQNTDDPNAVDAQGMPNEVPGSGTPGTDQVGIDPKADPNAPMDPNALQDPNALPPGQNAPQPGQSVDPQTGMPLAPMQPEMLDQNGNPLPSETGVDPKGMPYEGPEINQGDTPPLGPNGLPMDPSRIEPEIQPGPGLTPNDPREMAQGDINQMGQEPGQPMLDAGYPHPPAPQQAPAPPGVQGDTMPTEDIYGQPLGPDGPLSPDEVGEQQFAPDGQPYDTAQEGDQSMMLVCDNCGSEFESSPPMSVTTDQPTGSQDGTVEGDVCPECGQGLLVTETGDATDAELGSQMADMEEPGVAKEQTDAEASDGPDKEDTSAGGPPSDGSPGGDTGDDSTDEDDEDNANPYSGRK